MAAEWPPTHNPEVAGSNPAPATYSARFARIWPNCVGRCSAVLAGFSPEVVRGDTSVEELVPVANQASRFAMAAGWPPKGQTCVFEPVSPRAFFAGSMHLRLWTAGGGSSPGTPFQNDLPGIGGPGADPVHRRSPSPRSSACPRVSANHRRFRSHIDSGCSCPNHELVFDTPHPVFARLQRAEDRVLGCARMAGCMPVLR